jgi:hypothetical protein
LPVQEALALHASDRRKSAINITDAERDSVVVAEIIFGQVPVQMLLSAVLLDAAHPAFEDRKITFR